MLAGDAATPLSGKLPLSGEASNDDEAFLFAACGEVNSGKSSFLNGLLGTRDLCEVSDLPLSHPVRHYRHGPSDKDETYSEHLEHCHRPIERLRDYEVVDTPAIQNNTDHYPPELVTLLTKADLIFCVVS